ncbi:ankyrin repeat domain-containing protein [Streptomyces sp. NPDC002812]|uniref:ankyrin repeat domain-containing protein n=1 Tax=Streptomyces sp. NPDC002812 TaxID=3154434 RepID=UPI0033208EF1
MTGRKDGWAGMGWGWADHADVARRLDEGADPEAWSGGRPLHRAAVWGSPRVVAELAGRVVDVDALQDGTTALWEAVWSDRPDTARALAAAGADPWKPLIGGWSPGRLSLAGPNPGLFEAPEGMHGLSLVERTAARAGARLVAALAGVHYEGTSLACVAGIDAEEAIRRLEAVPVCGRELEQLREEPWAHDFDASLQLVGVTTVRGGCVLTQPWGYIASAPGVVTRLSAGTLCYGLYANPKSGDQGSIARNGSLEGSDLHPGGAPSPGDSSEEVLTSYLYRHSAAAYACGFPGLRLTDARAVTGPPDMWVELPQRNYWEQ